MVRSASPWLRGLLRVGKSQQRSVARALTVLLAPPKPAAKLKAAAKPKVAPKPRAAVTPRAALAPGPIVKPRVVAKSAAVAKPVAVKPRPVRAAPPKPVREALPPLAPADGKWLTAQYAADSGHGGMPGRHLSYWLYLPNVVAPPGGLPLIVMLHGCDQSATLFAQGTRMNQLAGQEGYAVMYPQQSVSAHPHRCWKWYDRATQQGGGDVHLIVGALGKVMDAYPIDRSRMYICGISAGAAMANIVALNHPELFAGLGMHSAPLYGAGHSTMGALAVMKHGNSSRMDSAIAEVKARRPGFPAMPTMLIGGEADEIVRPVNQAQLMRQAMLLNELGDGVVKVARKAGNKRGLPYRLHDVWRGRKLMLRVAQIDELKHAWSGGDERLSFNSGAGPDASKMLVEFFGRHRRIQAKRK